MVEPRALTESQRKGFIEAVIKNCHGWVDAFERSWATPKERFDAEYYFLAGVRWAQKEQR